MPTNYTLHVISRSIHNRTARAALPAPPRKKHHIGTDQLRVVAGQRVVVNEDFIMRNLADIKAKAAGHILEVRTMDGRKVDLETLQGAPAPAIPPLPKVKLDSVEDDKNFKYPPGYKYIPPGGPSDQMVPQILQPGEKPALMRPEEPPAPPAPVTSTESELDEVIEKAQEAASGDEEK
jgi:hypothetical protein